MSEKVFWVYNGWAVLLTVLGPIFFIICAESVRYTFALRPWPIPFAVVSIVILLFLSNWITALLYFPCLLIGLALGSIVKHRGLGG